MKKVVLPKRTVDEIYPEEANSKYYYGVELSDKTRYFVLMSVGGKVSLRRFLSVADNDRFVWDSIFDCLVESLRQGSKVFQFNSLTELANWLESTLKKTNAVVKKGSHGWYVSRPHPKYGVSDSQYLVDGKWAGDCIYGWHSSKKSAEKALNAMGAA